MLKHVFHHRVLVLLIVLLAFVLSACETAGTYQKSYKVLSGSKAAMENLALTAKHLHMTGVLNDDQIAKAKEAYRAAQAVQTEFIAAQVAAVRTGDETTQIQVANLGVAYLQAANRFIVLALEYGLIQSDDPSIQEIIVK